MGLGLGVGLRGAGTVDWARGLRELDFPAVIRLLARLATAELLAAVSAVLSVLYEMFSVISSEHRVGDVVGEEMVADRRLALGGLGLIVEEEEVEEEVEDCVAVSLTSLSVDTTCAPEVAWPAFPSPW